MGSKNMEDELEEAVAELNAFCDFYMEISELSPEEMVEKVEEMDPEFIEHIQAMDEPPKSVGEFWSGYGIWAISGLRGKYSHIWSEVSDTYFRSDVRRQLREKSKFMSAIWSQIDEILKNSNF